MASQEPRLQDIPSSELRWVGKQVQRIEDPELVTGRTEFIDNVTLPGMRHCAIFHSTHAHARIVSIDTSEAEKLPGVAAVITGKEILDWTEPSGDFPEGCRRLLHRHPDGGLYRAGQSALALVADDKA
jgi:CO/xanthine dehydrogenase Mo-binding subunit